MKVTRIIYLYGVVLLAPADLAHEMTHVVAASSWADRAEIVSWIPAYAEMDYPAGTPLYAIKVANVAPTLVGLFVIPLIPIVAGVAPKPVEIYIYALWVIYTMPSGADLAPLFEY